MINFLHSVVLSGCTWNLLSLFCETFYMRYRENFALGILGALASICKFKSRLLFLIFIKLVYSSHIYRNLNEHNSLNY